MRGDELRRRKGWKGGFELTISILILVIFCVCTTMLGSDSKQISNCIAEHKDDAPPMTLSSFIALNKMLISTEETEHCECGCPKSPIPECPRRYSVNDVENSARVNHDARLTSKLFNDYMHLELVRRRRQSQIQCLSSNSEITDTGGWCLSKSLGPKTMTLPFPDRPLTIAKGHVPVDKRFTENVIEFIMQENMTSISDFGAGQGQYGVEIVKAFPESFIYRGYDGAGDVAIYTQNFLSFFDLTIPLNFPVTDWVMSIEVGEHIPSQMEGMVIRNLHAHNCKGIVMSWAKKNQAGHHHVNNHDQEYLVDIFGKLGYEKDEEASIKIISGVGYGWLRNTFVLRRTVPLC